MLHQNQIRSAGTVLLLALLSSFSVSAKYWPRDTTAPFEGFLRQSSSPWQDFTPEGEEFSVLMPEPPRVSQGSQLYLTRDVLVNFRIYRTVHENVLFVIQSYESTTAPKELVRHLFSNRKKGLTFGGDLVLNRYKGKAFTQTGERFSDKGVYFIAHNHIYIVEAAKRDAFDPAIDQFLSSFKLQAVRTALDKLPTSAISNLPTQATLDDLYWPKDITRKVIILSKLEPGFTPAAWGQITGTVRLKATLSSLGCVENIEVLSGLPEGLTEQAIEASKTVVFIPAEKDGKSVSQRILQEYSFRFTP